MGRIHETPKYKKIANSNLTAYGICMCQRTSLCIGKHECRAYNIKTGHGMSEKNMARARVHGMSKLKLQNGACLAIND